MASTSQVFISAPIAEGAVALLKKSAATGPITFKFENTGANAIAGKLQESVDGLSFTDIAGATLLAAPGGEDVKTVITAKPYVRILASGDTSAKVDVTYEGRAFRGTMDLMAIGEKVIHDNL